MSEKMQHCFNCGADIGRYDPLPSYLPEACHAPACAQAKEREIADLAEHQRLRNEDDDYACRKGQQWAGVPGDGDETKQMIQRLRGRLIEMPDPDGGTSEAYQSLYLIAMEAVDGCEALESECDEYDAQTVRYEKNLRYAAVEIERLRTKPDAVAKPPVAPAGLTYNCRTHGDWDAARASGCPECVAHLRSENKKLSGLLERESELHARVEAVCETLHIGLNIQAQELRVLKERVRSICWQPNARHEPLSGQ